MENHRRANSESVSSGKAAMSVSISSAEQIKGDHHSVLIFNDITSLKATKRAESGHVVLKN